MKACLLALTWRGCVREVISETRKNVRFAKCETQTEHSPSQASQSIQLKGHSSSDKDFPDTPALNIWRSGPVLHIYKLNWYIAERRKKKLGRKQPFQPVKKPLESIPLP